MRKIVILIGIALAAASAGAHANYDIPDAKDCRSKQQATVMTAANGAKEPDRLAVCVNQGGMTLFYFGGEMQSEDPRNDGFGGTCGAIIVADQNVAQGNNGEDFDNNGPDGRPGTSDDFHC